MTSSSDRKDDEKLVATNLKNKEIFVLVCWDFPEMNGVYENLIVSFGILKFFVLTKIRQ